MVRTDDNGGHTRVTAQGPAKPTSLPDREASWMAQAVLARDPEAVTVVMGWVREIARHRAWGFDTPEDLVQETLLALLQNLRRGRFREGNLKHYVRRIAKNICVSSYRRARIRGKEQPLPEGASDSRSGLPAEAVEHRLMIDSIFAGLEARCRRLIRLAFFEKLSRREIAERLGISETATKVRLFRCMEKAREIAQR